MGTDLTTIQDFETAFQEILRLNKAIWDLKNEIVDLKGELSNLAFEVIDLKAEQKIPKFIGVGI